MVSGEPETNREWVAGVRRNPPRTRSPPQSHQGNSPKGPSSGGFAAPPRPRPHDPAPPPSPLTPAPAPRPRPPATPPRNAPRAAPRAHTAPRR
ncbi:hypothetical protein ELQ87_26325 [Streptomyces griseoviridis]|uniref:Uncharacterized protein n=1 Tax=Streptomyces griseoviridis TaxID=45398 RepID=A0A3Q9KW34_STRGD|nr:hypothetical protein ELQ87_26325 [Streptomyces griseoviridis]